MSKPMFGVWLHEDTDPVEENRVETGWCGDGHLGRYETCSLEDAEAYARDLSERNPTCRYEAQPFPPGRSLKAGEVVVYGMCDDDAPAYPTRPTEFRRLLEGKLEEFGMAGLLVSHSEGSKFSFVEPYATSEEALARALFATDERIEAFVALKAERPEDRNRVMRIAWERDELGARSAAEARAKRMRTTGELAPMLVGTTPTRDEISKAIVPLTTKGA